MKLKCQPEDFVVNEVSGRKPTQGPFALYELRKRGIGTLEALQTYQREFDLPAGYVAHAGLKDRHAVTTQFITVRNGAAQDFHAESFQLRYLGRTAKPLTADDIVANRFSIVLRSLDATEVATIRQRLSVVERRGYLNYFDEQRFGSLGASGEYIAAAWCQKNYERALWLALAEHNAHDRREEREQKAILRDHWGDWQLCKDRLDRSHRRSIVTYLVDHPEGFRKAFALLNPNLRGLYLSAFQSAVWNRMLALLVSDSLDDQTASGVQIADLTVPIDIPGGLCDRLPLPSVRLKQSDAALRSLMDRALQPFDMRWRDMKVSFPRDRWFSKAQRATCIQPANLAAEFSTDEIYDGHQKLTLSFELPRGCYATMLIKTLTTAEQMADDVTLTEATKSRTGDCDQP
ncbi:MAG: tRNA pseudouridine(13) synthase TruD [Fuerstiella sp.]